MKLHFTSNLKEKSDKLLFSLGKILIFLLSKQRESVFTDCKIIVISLEVGTLGAVIERGSVIGIKS